MRELRMAATGRPAPFRLGAPAYLVALGGWLAAALWLLASAPELVGLSLSSRGPVAAAHALGLVFFPFAVAAAVWQLLPVMLRNDPPRTGHRWVVVVLLLAGVPLVVAVDTGRGLLGAASATLLGLGMVLLVGELALLVYRAPRGRLLVVSRAALGLAVLNAVAAFALGAVAFADGGPEPLGVPFERFLLVHLSLAVLGWLTVMILAVGRTLVPMLAASAAAPPRRVPVPEVVLVAGLWIYAAGIAGSLDVVAALGIVVMVAALAVPARRFVVAAFAGKFGSEGPGAHVAVGLVFLVQAAAVALFALAGVGDGRRAAAACVLFVGIGWATGVVLGHLGKLVSLSGWGSWPPGPRPKQADLYPGSGWQAELVLFAAGVELLSLGVLASRTWTTRVGGALLVASAIVALVSGAETIRRVAAGRSAGSGLASQNKGDVLRHKT